MSHVWRLDNRDESRERRGPASRPGGAPAGVVLLSLAAGPVRRRLSFSVPALGALLVDGLLTMVLAATRWYWVALALWAAISGLGSSSTSTPRSPCAAYLRAEASTPHLSVSAALPHAT
jgi:hypothetical protein